MANRPPSAGTAAGQKNSIRTHNLPMTLLPFRNFPRQWLTILAVIAIWGSGVGGVGRSQTSNPPVAEKVGAAATEVTKATLNNIQLLWTRIDEKRLMNRTPDELVA